MGESTTPRAKLTKKVVDAASFDPWQKTANGRIRKKEIIWDAELVGLGLRRQPPSKRKPNGDKMYIVNYRNADGVMTYLTLGRHGGSRASKRAPRRSWRWGRYHMAKRKLLGAAGSELTAAIKGDDE